MRALCFVLLCGALAAAQKLEFEAASLKPVTQTGRPGPPRMKGGPGTDDPTTWSYQSATLASLIGEAFSKKFFEVVAPDWTQWGRFDVIAKVPPGTTPEQFRSMLQNLLVERFQLAVHLEKKQATGYALKLAANRTKLRESVPVLRQPDPVPGGPVVGPDGYPVFRKGSGISMAIMDGRARYALRNETVSAFAEKLGGQLRGIVTDETGLAGKYDIDLYWDARTVSPPGEELGPDLIHAVKEQLGLTLEARKVSAEMLVIDHAERVPAAN